MPYFFSASSLRITGCSLLLAVSFSLPRIATAADDTTSLPPLLKLMQQRLDIAPMVAKSKWNDQLPVNDPVRENQLLKKLTETARQSGITDDLARRFFQAQFDAGKLIQTAQQAQWRAQQLGRFADAPDLARDVRPALDQLTPAMLTALRQVQDHLCSPAVQAYLEKDGMQNLSAQWNEEVAATALSGLRCTESQTHGTH